MRLFWLVPSSGSSERLAEQVASTKFVEDRQVFIDLDLKSREEALDFLGQKAVEFSFANDAEKVKKAFYERECLGETGMIDGFAVPHAKSEAIKRAGILFIRLCQPVEWPSFDNVAVDVILALLVPAEQAGTTHIKLLSKCAVMLMDESFRRDMRQLSSAEQIAKRINQGIES